MKRAEGLLAGWRASRWGGLRRTLTDVLAPPPRSDDVCVVALRFGA